MNRITFIFTQITHTYVHNYKSTVELHFILQVYVIILIKSSIDFHIEIGKTQLSAF